MFENQIKAGIALLNHKYPGWHSEINIYNLDMASRGYCVLGQLYEYFDDGLKALDLSFSGACQYGFAIPYARTHEDMKEVEDKYIRLTEEWKTELTNFNIIQLDEASIKKLFEFPIAYRFTMNVTPNEVINV